ncbi:hypothetical protein [Klebsiella michiganensis]|uniref:hypothetical protein n=1 Tax=Klebsiella michiganensis TaxID=1134687 RepID=UPI003EE261E5
MTNNQLAPERISDISDYFVEMQDHYSDPADRENFEIFRDAELLMKELQERRKAASEPVAYLVCNGRLYQDRAFMSPLMAEESVKNRNDGAEIKALCVCGKAECAE